MDNFLKGVIICLAVPFLVVGGFFLAALWGAINILLAGLTGYVIAKILLFIAPVMVSSFLGALGITIPLPYLLALVYILNSFLVALSGNKQNIQDVVKNTYKEFKDNF